MKLASVTIKIEVNKGKPDQFGIRFWIFDGHGGPQPARVTLASRFGFGDGTVQGPFDIALHPEQGAYSVDESTFDRLIFKQNSSGEWSYTARVKFVYTDGAGAYSMRWKRVYVDNPYGDHEWGVTSMANDAPWEDG